MSDYSITSTFLSCQYFYNVASMRSQRFLNECAQVTMETSPILLGIGFTALTLKKFAPKCIYETTKYISITFFPMKFFLKTCDTTYPPISIAIRRKVDHIPNHKALASIVFVALLALYFVSRTFATALCLVYGTYQAVQEQLKRRDDQNT